MRRLLSVLLAIVSFLAVSALTQDASKASGGRRVLQRVVPPYPEMARSVNISGTVRLTVTVAPNGSVKSVQALGGNPVFIKAAQDAIAKWKFAPATVETNELIELRFQR